MYLEKKPSMSQEFPKEAYIKGFAKAGAISLALSTSVMPVAFVYTVIRKPPPRPMLCRLRMYNVKI